MSRQPLSTPLSQVLVAFTIEFDNEFERRFAETGLGRRFGMSMVMWSNFMRFVGDGITVGELSLAAGLPKARVLSNLLDRSSRAAVVSRSVLGSARPLSRMNPREPHPAGYARKPRSRLRR